MTAPSMSHTFNQRHVSPHDLAKPVHNQKTQETRYNGRATGTPNRSQSLEARTRPTARNASVVEQCRFKTTQTSRRRMDYSSNEILPVEDPAARTLSSEQESTLLEDITKLYERLLPSAAGQLRRHDVLQKLRSIIALGFPQMRFDVHIFGSSGNKLFTDKSDVDICVTMQDLDTTCTLAELLFKNGMKHVKCVHAKAVPIVKVYDPDLDLNCDLNLNNHVALRNTRLIRTYIELDERVRPLALIIKHWTKRRVISEASGGTLSSYTWTLLLINFLQTRQPPVLPCIKLVDDSGKHRTDYKRDVEDHRQTGSSNKETLPNLLFGFFRYYGYEVDFDTTVISVRKGAVLTKSEKGWDRANNNRLCVEEPFNTDRNLANTADDFAWRGLHLELRRAFDLVAQAQSIDTVVCEQYEFPPEQPKLPIERPPALPKPTLTRSLSQTGRTPRAAQTRSGRHSGGRESSNRRASSAAAFGHYPFPLLYPSVALSPEMVQNGLGVHDHLAQLSRQLSAQEQQLREQQVRLRMQSSAATHRAFSQPQRTNAASADRSADEGVPTSYIWPSLGSSSTFAGTASPPSPSSSTSTLRRAIHRDAPQSQSNSARSQSQPARVAAPQFMTSIPILYPQVLMDARRTPLLLQPHRIVGQVQTPQGLYYLIDHSMTDAQVPMEYLGYGFREMPFPNQIPPSVPVAGMYQPFRPSATTPPTTAPSRSQSPFPQPALRQEGLQSAPLPQGPWQSMTRSYDLSPPMVINGATRSPATAATTNGIALHHDPAEIEISRNGWSHSPKQDDKYHESETQARGRRRDSTTGPLNVESVHTKLNGSSHQDRIGTDSDTVVTASSPQMDSSRDTKVLSPVQELSFSSVELSHRPEDLSEASQTGRMPATDQKEEPSTEPVNPNPWQQAGSKKTNRRSKIFQADKGRSRGEALPADFSQRKGG